MMRLHKTKGENSDSLALRGWAKFFHRLFLFITFPFRKPLYLLAALALLYIVPIFLKNVPPLKVYDWYKEQFITAYNDFDMQKIKDILPKGEGEDYRQGKKNEKIASIPNRRKVSRRKAFEVSSKEAKVVSQEGEWGKPEYVEATEQVSYEFEAVLPGDIEEVKRTTNTNRKLDLQYLDKPKEVLGTAEVNSANEIEIEGERIFFYGIYATPTTVEGIEAKEFLTEFLKGQKVKCSIVAYTTQNIATAFCYVNGQNINKLLVEKGLSRNIAL